jgi:hypothetical protein
MTQLAPASCRRFSKASTKWPMVQPATSVVSEPCPGRSTEKACNPNSRRTGSHVDLSPAQPCIRKYTGLAAPDAATAPGAVAVAVAGLMHNASDANISHRPNRPSPRAPLPSLVARGFGGMGEPGGAVDAPRSANESKGAGSGGVRLRPLNPETSRIELPPSAAACPTIYSIAKNSGNGCQVADSRGGNDLPGVQPFLSCRRPTAAERDTLHSRIPGESSG